MRQPHFLDPLGSRLPAMERNMLKLRAMQISSKNPATFCFCGGAISFNGY